MPLAFNHPPIALLAGKGDLPHLLINVFQSQQRPFVVLAFKGQTEEDLVKDVPHLWLSFGEIGKALDYTSQHKIKEVVMAGTITRPTMREILPDWEGVKWLAKIGTKAFGDDNLLKVIVELLEKYGYRVVGPEDILKELLSPEGLLTVSKPDEQAWRDIGRGIEVLSALSPADVGQAVVVQEDLVLAVEAIEGTDAMLTRAKALKRTGLGGVLIKIAKRQQDQRVDLPTIGPETIRRVAEAGLRGIAIEAERTIIIKREETISLAEEKELFLLALEPTQCHRSH